MKYFICTITILLLVPFLMWAEEAPEPTIRQAVNNGYWSSASTWDQNRVPIVGDVVEINQTVRLKRNYPTVRGIIIREGGILRGRNQYFQGGLTTTEYFENRGVVGGYIHNLNLQGTVINHGITNVSQLYIEPGTLRLEGTVVIPVRLRGDIKLGGNMTIDAPLYGYGHTLASGGYDMQLQDVLSGITINGSAEITINGAPNQVVRLDNFKAPNSLVELRADTVHVTNNYHASSTEIINNLYLNGAGQTFSGNMSIANSGSVYGDSWRLRHGITIEGSVTNEGTFGPHVFPTITGDFINLGTYAGNEITLSGNGERNVIGEIPQEIRLAGEQTWLSSPTIFGLRSNGYELILATTSQLTITNILDEITILGGEKIVLTNPTGEDAYSANIQSLYAPDARVVFDNKRGRIGGDIIARILEFVEDVLVSDDVTLQANQVAFIGGSLTGYGSSRYYQVTVDTPELLGSGHLGPYTDVRLNTDVPLGFTSSGKVRLEHTGAGWGGKYRLAGTIADLMTNIVTLGDFRGPNIASQLNSGQAHYYSYESNGRWTTPLTLNNAEKAYLSRSTIPKQNFFYFDFIVDQTKSGIFPVSITTPTDMNFSGEVRLSAINGQIYPGVIQVENGLWQGDVELFDPVLNQQIIATGVGTHAAHSGRSNRFAVHDSERRWGQISGVVREQDASRSGSTTLIFNNARGEEYQVTTDSDGEFSLELLCGEYLVQATGYKGTASVGCNESTILPVDLNIALQGECQQNGSIPVLLVPGIMGSDRTDNNEWFPKLYKHIPYWDSGELEIHNPGIVGVAPDPGGWQALQDSLVAEGYQKNCTVFTVPYEWSLSVPDIAEQYLQPWIDHAKSVASTTQVDIIAHSMGGLVARSYIQSTEYQSDVRKLAMVGTPNQGSANAYFAWEGGDPLAMDELSDGFGSRILDVDQFQSRTITHNHLIKTNEVDPLCYRSNNNLVLGNNYFVTSVNTCKRKDAKQFVRTYAPSLGNLYPTYEFLFDNNRNPVEPSYQNIFLQNLNLGNVSELVETKLFLGNNINTLANIYIDPSKKGGILYTDGEVTFTNSDLGDGTVLTESVEYKSTFETEEAKNIKLHAFLVEEFADEIINFIKK